MKQFRPINNGIVGHSSPSGLYVTNPENPEDKPRIVLKPNGFHFEAYDFEGLTLPFISLENEQGELFNISFNSQGELLINGLLFQSPTNSSDEIINGNKQYTGLTELSGGLVLHDEQGLKYSITIDSNGVLSAKKEVI